MTISNLCELIELQPEIKSRVLSFSDNFDFQSIQHYLEELKIPEQRKSARISLMAELGEDPGHIKILSCMLKAASDAYDFYQEKGISDKIYIDTMKCFTRFINETYAMTGTYAFDREWWTARQIGCLLFRIGELEYEIEKISEIYDISIHIPSDADFSDECCDASFKAAEEFFAQYYPEYADCEYVCHSWLLAPELNELLKPTSNILAFQKRFDITVNGVSDLEYIQWVFKTNSTNISSLKENTSLQKALKNHLMNGKYLSDASGVLNRVGEISSDEEISTSHTTVRTVRYTAVQST